MPKSPKTHPKSIISETAGYGRLKLSPRAPQASITLKQWLLSNVTSVSPPHDATQHTVKHSIYSLAPDPSTPQLPPTGEVRASKQCTSTNHIDSTWNYTSTTCCRRNRTSTQKKQSKIAFEKSQITKYAKLRIPTFHTPSPKYTQVTDASKAQKNIEISRPRHPLYPQTLQVWPDPLIREHSYFCIF